MFFDVLAAYCRKQTTLRNKRMSSFGEFLLLDEISIADDAVDEKSLDENYQSAHLRLLCASFAAIAGIIFSTWPLLAQIDISGSRPRLSPYAFFFCFSVGFLFASLLIVTVSLCFPRTPILAGHATGTGLKCSHITSPTLVQHALGGIAGAIWASGTLGSLVASQSVSLVVSLTIARCAPLVGAIWGLFFWRNDRRRKNSASRMFLYVLVLHRFD